MPGRAPAAAPPRAPALGDTAAPMSSDQPIWKRPRAQLYALAILLWAVMLGVLSAAHLVLLPFVLAALAAYVIDPIIARLTRLPVGGWRVPRSVAVLVVYVALALLIWLGAVSIFPQIYREAMRALLQLRDFVASATPERIDGWARSIDAFLQRYGIPVDVIPGGNPGAGRRFSVDLASGIADALREASAAVRVRLGDVVPLSRAVLALTFQTVFFAVLLFMLTAFMSMDAPRIVRWFETLVPAAWRPDFRRLLTGIDSGLAGVVRGQITIMAVNGVLTLAGLLVLRVPFAFALSALATILYVVPFFGTILSSIPIVLVALGAGGFPLGLGALAWIVGIHALETYVLNPKIMGDAARIHPVLIVLALVLGERFYGIVGALLAVPVASVFVATFRFLHRKFQELDEEVARAASPSTVPTIPAAPERPREKGSAP
jgi:predicted PurR-regulated permease PerM